jgi:hypothetical protein
MAGARGTLETRGGVLGRSVMGFRLGAPGRGGASGNELRRPDGRTLSGIEPGGAPSAGGDGSVGSEGAAGFDSSDDFRLAGGGGGVCDL